MQGVRNRLVSRFKTEFKPRLPTISEKANVYPYLKTIDGYRRESIGDGTRTLDKIFGYTYTKREPIDVKNSIIQWDSPNVEIKKKVTYLGVVRADPDKYMQEYGNSLVESEQLPEYIKSIPKPEGIKLLAADVKPDTTFDDIEQAILEAIRTKEFEVVDTDDDTENIEEPFAKNIVEKETKSTNCETVDIHDLHFTEGQIEFIVQNLRKNIVAERQLMNYYSHYNTRS